YDPVFTEMATAIMRDGFMAPLSVDLAKKVLHLGDIDLPPSKDHYYKAIDVLRAIVNRLYQLYGTQENMGPYSLYLARDASLRPYTNPPEVPNLNQVSLQEATDFWRDYLSVSSPRESKLEINPTSILPVSPRSSIEPVSPVLPLLLDSPISPVSPLFSPDLQSRTDLMSEFSEFD